MTEPLQRLSSDNPEIVDPQAKIYLLWDLFPVKLSGFQNPQLEGIEIIEPSRFWKLIPGAKLFMQSYEYMFKQIVYDIETVE